MHDAETVQLLKLAVSLVGICSALLTVLTLVLRHTVLKERKVAAKHHNELKDQGITLSEIYTQFSNQIQNLNTALDYERNQIYSLRRELNAQIEKLDEIRKGFGGYFEITRKRLESMDARIQVVEASQDQVIRIGKKIAARIRGKAV